MLKLTLVKVATAHRSIPVLLPITVIVRSMHKISAVKIILPALKAQTMYVSMKTVPPVLAQPDTITVILLTFPLN